MDVTIETLKILVLLLPGFVASGLLNAVVVQKPKDHLGQLIEALIFSFLIYVFLIGVFRLAPTVKIVGGDEEAVNPTFLLATAATAIVLPLIFGFFIRNDLHMKLFRVLRITDKTARRTTWLDVFTNEKRYVIVNLSDGRRACGWPEYYSDDPEEGLLYLYDPAWGNENGSYTELDLHGIFLVKKDLIESIEFTHITKKNAMQRPKGECLNETKSSTDVGEHEARRRLEQATTTPAGGETTVDPASAPEEGLRVVAIDPRQGTNG